MEDELGHFKLETYHNPRVMGMYGLFGAAVGAAGYALHIFVARRGTTDMTEMLNRNFTIQPKLEDL